MRPFILFFDDDPYRFKLFREKNPSAVWVNTVPKVLPRLTEEWDVVFLDHDLGGETYVSSDRRDTGMEVVRWVVKHKPQGIKEFVVHTMNHRAGREMVQLLTQAGYKTSYQPFFNMFALQGWKIDEDSNLILLENDVEEDDKWEL